jgi:hypothetical protein
MSIWRAGGTGGRDRDRGENVSFRAIATVVSHPDAQWIGRRLLIREDSGGGGRPLTAIRGRIHHEEQADEASQAS